MKVYKVKVWIEHTYEIEAKDEDEAHEKAHNSLWCDLQGGNLDTETEIEVSDNQYTDQQELADRERDI